ncbi:MAG: RDD family protein [Deltaproteobacteria bacterium]|nr:RDD family protein [Deltaproteobacteria bacterium]
MKRRDRQPEQPDLLFDPPLRHPSRKGAEDSPEPGGERRPSLEDQSLRGQSLPLFPETSEVEGEQGEVESVEGQGAEEVEPEVEPVEGSDTSSPSKVSMLSRLFAGVVDLTVHGAVLLLVLIGELALGIQPSWAQWPAFAVFLLAFSFPYAAIALAFWGQTPGMSVAGFEVRTADGENLTLPQTALRWFAAVLSYGLLGLPLVLAITGRSLGDLLSRSEARYLDP